MRRFLAPALLALGLAACGPDDKPIVHATSETTTAAVVTEPEPTTTTTTTEPEPEPTTTTTALVPGSENDPDGPILCAGLRHPSHHKPCPAPSAPAATRTPSSTGSAPAPARTAPASRGGNTSGVDIECESGGDYSINTGNGYYGAYQFLPSTFRVAMGQALAQGRIDQATYDAYAGTRPDLAPAWVQDAAAAAHVAAGHREAWPNC